MTTGGPSDNRFVSERRSRGGFTLIELLVVCTLLALAATAASWSVRRPIAAARSELAADRFRAADAGARDLAMRRGEAIELTIDLSRDTLSRGVANAGGAGSATTASGLQLAEFRRAGLTQRSGRVALLVRPDGSSSTYAVRFDGVDESPWLLFAGGTGQPVRLADEDAVDALLNLDRN